MNPKGTPSHYASLDGLRGVAAVIVLLYHIGEAHAVDRFTPLMIRGQPNSVSVHFSNGGSSVCSRWLFSEL